MQHRLTSVAALFSARPVLAAGTRVFFGPAKVRTTLSLLVLLGVSALAGVPARAMDFAASLAFYTGSGPVSVIVGDFNGDGRPDLAVAVVNGTFPAVSVLLGNGDGTFLPGVDYPTGGDPHSVTVGDFNGDGRPDLAVAATNGGSSVVSVLLGNGDGTFQARIDYATGSDPYSVTVGDFNGDGWPDLAVANMNAASVSVLLGNGDGTFQARVDYATGNGPYSVTVGDFDGDGRPDLAVANMFDDTVSVLLGHGNGTFPSRANYDSGVFPHSVTVGDFNGDGRPDLAVANMGATSVSVLLGNGDGTFQARVDYPTGDFPASVTVGDFNGDGRPDLAVANMFSDSVSVLLGNGDGSLQAKVDYPAGSGPNSVIVGDFNGDGKPDLALTDNPSNVVSVLLNSTPVVTGVTPASLNFGSLASGSTSAPRTVIISNDGAGRVEVSGITLAGTDPGQFSVVTGTCPSLTPTIAAGGSCTVSVSFVPTGAGARSATLLVASNDPLNPVLNVSLTGTGIPLYSLSVGFAGTGGGSVTGAAQGYANSSCDKGLPGSCTPATYQAGTLVSLSATPDWKSTFSAWGGVDSPPGDAATVTLNANRTVTATFDHINKVDLQPGNTLYASIQDAYKDATSGGTIQAQDYPFLEGVTIADSTIAEITLSGGLDTAYQPTPGYSTIQSLFIQSGKVIVRNVKIRP